MVERRADIAQITQHMWNKKNYWVLVSDEAQVLVSYSFCKKITAFSASLSINKADFTASPHPSKYMCTCLSAVMPLGPHRRPSDPVSLPCDVWSLTTLRHCKELSCCCCCWHPCSLSPPLPATTALRSAKGAWPAPANLRVELNTQIERLFLPSSDSEGKGHVRKTPLLC